MSSIPPSNRPTTPLRSLSRTSLRASLQTPQTPSLNAYQSPLSHLEPQLSELSDSLSDLESNLTLLSLQHSSITRFTENFAAFLYGVDMNAYCVDWIEAPSSTSWARAARRRADAATEAEAEEDDGGGVTPKRFTTGNGTVGVGSDVSGVSIASASTSRTGTSGGSRLRTPARKSGIARAGNAVGRTGSRPGSVASSSMNAVRGGAGRGRAGNSAGLAARGGRGRGIGRGTTTTVRDAVRGGRGRGLA